MNLYLPPRQDAELKRNRRSHRSLRLFLSVTLSTFFFLNVWSTESSARQISDPNAPIVSKIEPPSWWINFTPEVMLLLSGQNLQVTHAECNLPNVIVERTESTSGGRYLFVWLKLAAGGKTGTAVCRLTTLKGNTSFELPLSARAQRLGRNQGMAPGDVIYLIAPDRFANGDPLNDEPDGARGTHDRADPRAYHGGDLRGIRERLSYLKDLGVTTLLLTPVVKGSGPQDDQRRGAADLYAVDPHFGTVGEYRGLVEDAHQQGMKVLFDLGLNHVGPAHPWVANAPLPDWFHGTSTWHADSSKSSAESYDGKRKDDALEALADPHAPPRFFRNLADGWFSSALPDLNTENPVVAQYLLQESIWWAETSGLDGFRLDAFPNIPRKFWSAWHSQIRRFYPFLATIGEVPDRDSEITSFFAGGQKRYDGIDSGVNTLFDFPLCFALRDVLLQKATANRLPDVLRHDSLYVHPESLVTFFGSDEMPRFASAGSDSLPKEKLAFGLLLTLRGIPELYYGDEIGMRDGANTENRRDFPGGWRDDPQNAFTEAGRTPDQQALFSYVRALLHLRQEHPALQTGKLWHLAWDDSSYVFLRESPQERLLVAFNDSTQLHELVVPVSDTPAAGSAEFTLIFGEAKAEAAPREVRLALPAQSISIFALN